MTGPEHYREAEKYVEAALAPGLRDEVVSQRAAVAQVHATLALAAATIDAGNATEFHGAQDHVAHEVAYSTDWAEVTR